MMGARIKGSQCTNCGEVLTGASNTGLKDLGERPSPGDATVCLYCGHLMVFSKTLKLRNPNNAELIKFAGDRAIIHAQMICADYRRMKEKEKGGR